MASKDPYRPNVVFVLTDDQGPWAMGCAGNAEIRTPNLDRLAATGTRFDRFFCTSPVCSPARASILTGQLPSRHGVHDWIRAGNVRTDDSAPQPYLAGQLAYTDVLAANGYDCGLSGKWHLGDSARPQHGFTHWYAHQLGGGPYYDAPVVRDGTLTTESGYITDAITDDALEFLDTRAGTDRPFYAGVHYTAPHSPWIDQHPTEYVDLYRDCAFDSCPDEAPHEWSLPETVPRQTRERRLETLRGYFASVTALDHGVGRIIDRLEQLGLRQSTLICFLSDNGFNCGHHGIWGKGNGTYPQNMYDTSVLVPALMSQPGRIPTGTVRSELLSGYDVSPTLLEYVGIEAPDELTASAPGRSFTSLLRGSPTSDESDGFVVVYDEYGPVRMIRTREWKYVHRYPDGPNELYDLVNDPNERANLAAEHGHQARLRELQRTLIDWFGRHSDPRRDGLKLPVTGKGQARRVDADRATGPAFFDLDGTTSVRRD